MLDLQWLLENAQPLVNSLGIFFDILGTWLVAWGMVRTYKENRYKTSTGFAINDLVVGQYKEDTKKLQNWKRNQYKKMKIGFAFLTFGFALQLISNWVK